MHIPRQPDGPRAPAPAGGRTTDGRGTHGVGADGLRARRQDLVGRLRAVAYWQRLVQARTDLLVAGLLYTAAPVPTPRSLPVPTPPGADLGPGVLDPADLHRLADLPDGLDVPRLLAGPCHGRHPAPEDTPGAHLDRLREAATLLARHRRALDEELDAVTLALHDRLAADGADDGRTTHVTGAQAHGTTAVVVP